MFKYKANHHVISVALKARWPRVRGMMAPVVSYGIFIKWFNLLSLGHAHLGLQRKKTKTSTGFKTSYVYGIPRREYILYVCKIHNCRIRSLTIEVFMSNMMLCMRNSNVGVGIQNVKMKMIHAIIHIQEKKKDPNHYTNL